jgi:hypothetical protein
MGLVRSQNKEYKKSEAMDTVRFSKIVEAAGKPDVHVLWIDPSKDSVLQKAIKANRVMTIHQQAAGAKTDYGTVGFEKNVSGQVLIFPESLRSFENNRVVGVKYDLLETASAPAPVPESQELPKVKPAKPPKKSKLKESHPKERKPKEIPEPSVEPAVVEEIVPETARVVEFPTPKVEEEARPNEAVEEIKNQIREAMKILEEGKQVAAYNLLKRIVE